MSASVVDRLIARSKQTRKQTYALPTKRLTKSDWLWIAGFMEGEGCFRAQTHRRYGHFILSAVQKQRWPLEKLLTLLGGSIGKPSRKTGCYRWTLSGVRAEALAPKFYPLMSPRRQQQITSALRKCR